MSSTHNENLYNKDQNGINGFAIKTGLLTQDKKIGFIPGYVFAGQIDYEFNNKFFKGIDRFRPVEFDRDWSYKPNDLNDPASDNIFNVKFLNLQVFIEWDY